MRVGRLLRSLGIPALLGALVLQSLLAAPASAIDTGQPAPDFNLLDLDGKVQSISDCLGKVVVLYFLGYEAEVCGDPARRIQERIADRYADRQVQVLGIDCWDGTPEELRRFRYDNAIRFPLLLSGQGTASDYDLPYNSVVVVDARGIVSYVGIGPDPSRIDIGEVEQAVRSSLNNANSISEETWGAIKTLYSRKKMNVS